MSIKKKEADKSLKRQVGAGSMVQETADFDCWFRNKLSAEFDMMIYFHGG